MSELCWTMWPDFWRNLSIVAKWLKFLAIFEDLFCIWQNCVPILAKKSYAVCQISLLSMAKYWKKCLVIWSHWCYVCFQFVNVEDCKALCVTLRKEDLETGDTAFTVAESILGIVLMTLLGLAIALGKL